jgi:5'-nucleotidase
MKKIILTLWFTFFTFGALNAEDANAIHVQLLGINDFHGNLEPPTGSGGKINGIDAGGIEYLATHIKALRQGHHYSVTLSAGDLFGASPLLSALFREEPTVEAMNLLGLDLNAVGNHEFDKGADALERLQYGDRETNFQGAQFKFLAANVMVNARGKTLFPGSEIREFGKVKVAFIGVVLQEMDKVTASEAIKGLSFLDEAESVNALIPELEAAGAHTFVVMIHEGGFPTGGFNECPGISGPIVEIAQRLDHRVGIILSGHTHQAYNCRINNKLVTSTANNGRLVTNIDLSIDPTTGKMLAASADNLIVTRDVKKDPEQSALIKKYKDQSAPIADKVVGVINESLTKGSDEGSESMLGRVIADAQLEASSFLPDHQKADVAFVNPGGIRTDLNFSSSPANEGDGKVTFSEAYAVQPFSNNVITMDLKGGEILELLEQQFIGCGREQPRILQISASLRYQVKKSGPICHKVEPKSIMIEGKALDFSQVYRVAANSFLAEGGDGFRLFSQGTNRQTGIADIDALTNYLKAHSPLSGPHEARISFLP